MPLERIFRADVKPKAGEYEPRTVEQLGGRELESFDAICREVAASAAKVGAGVEHRRGAALVLARVFRLGFTDAADYLEVCRAPDGDG